MTMIPSDDQLRRARRMIMRSAALWLPIFGLFGAGAVFFFVRAVTEDSGAWVGFAILGLIALLTLPLLVASLQDLRADPVETEGAVARKWRKSDFFLLRSHYLMVGKRVFRVEKAVWLESPDVPGRVHLLHYPHTNTLIDWRPVEEADPESDEATTPAARDWEPTQTAPAPTTQAGAPPVARAVEPPSFGGAFHPSVSSEPATDSEEQGVRDAPPPASPATQPGRVEPPRFGTPRPLNREGDGSGSGSDRENPSGGA